MAELCGLRAELLPDLVVFLIFSGIPLLRIRVLVTLPTHPFPVLVYLRTLESRCLIAFRGKLFFGFRLSALGYLPYSEAIL